MVWLDCMERFLGAVEGLENQIQLKCNVLGSKLEDKKCSHCTNLWVLSQPSRLLGFYASNRLQQLKYRKKKMYITGYLIAKSNEKFCSGGQIYKKIHLAHGNLAALVLWSILLFKIKLLQN